MGGDDGSSGVPVDYSIEQDVDIPAAQATLRFYLLIKDGESAVGSFAVKVDGTTVYSATDGTSGHSVYAPVSIDLSAFVGSARTLRFEATSQKVESGGLTDSFNFDDVSLVAPEALRTTITRARIRSKRRRASFRFAANNPGSHFKCKLDSKRFKRCSSPKVYRHLKVGKHVFKVEAVDAAGNADPTPAVRKFRITP